MNEERVIFQTKNERVQELVGMQHYDPDTDTYYTITRVAESQGVYTMYGTPLNIPELTNEEPR